MCDKCTHLRGRVLALAARIDKASMWDSYNNRVKRSAYNLLLKSIETHYKDTKHEMVDSVEIIIALGKRASG